jgi:hypothetical protein
MVYTHFPNRLDVIALSVFKKSSKVVIFHFAADAKRFWITF